MRYILYFFTMVLLFAGGMVVGNVFLPQRSTSLATAVSAPGVSEENPAMQQVTREIAEKDLELLNKALSACPVIVNEEKDRLLNQIKLRLALENFELKRLKFELEIAKNQISNRPTPQYIQANAEYKQAKEHVEKLADELFPRETGNFVIVTDEAPAENSAEAPTPETN